MNGGIRQISGTQSWQMSDGRQVTAHLQSYQLSKSSASETEVMLQQAAALGRQLQLEAHHDTEFADPSEFGNSGPENPRPESPETGSQAQTNLPPETSEAEPATQSGETRESGESEEPGGPDALPGGICYVAPRAIDAPA